MKNKLKKKSFWLALVGAVIVLLQAFGLKIDVPMLNEIITGLCSIAILLGFMIDDTKSTDNEKEEQGEKEDKTE